MGGKQHNLLSEALMHCRFAMLMVGLFSVAVNLLMLTTSVFMMQVYDRVLASGSRATLFYLAAIAGGALLALALLDVVRGRVLLRASIWLEQSLAPAVLTRSVDVALARRSERDESLQDLATLRGFLSGPGALFLFDVAWVPIYLVAVYLLHPLLGHIALAGALILFCLAVANDRLTRQLLKRAGFTARRAAHGFEAALRNAEVIDAMGLLDGIVARWETNGGAALRLQAQAGVRAGLVLGASRFFRLLAQVAILTAGAWLVLRQDLTGGAMIAASIIMGRALAPVEQAIGIWKQAVQAWDAKRRLAAFFARSQRRPKSMPLPAPTGRLSVENVVFGFEADRPPVLKGVSFALEPGEALAIVGPSAAGKSTLARLLVGIDKPNSGMVRLAGADVFAWSRTDLGPHLGYLPQDVELFSGTVAQNIARLGEVDPTAVVEAAKLAHCHDMVLRLDGGYGAELGEGGTRLSGGQRQRIALARALYGKPKLIVLDEPNANLDTDGEAALGRAIVAMKAAGAAIIVISHRPSTLAQADRVLVLVDGRAERMVPRQEIVAPLPSRPSHPVPDPTPARPAVPSAA